MTVSLRSFV